MTEGKVPVSERALVARLGRQLRKQGKALKKCRADSPWRHELGDYYVVLVAPGWGAVMVQAAIEARHVDIEAMAREMGCMAEWEVAVRDA